MLFDKNVWGNFTFLCVASGEHHQILSPAYHCVKNTKIHLFTHFSKVYERNPGICKRKTEFSIGKNEILGFDMITCERCGGKLQTAYHCDHNHIMHQFNKFNHTFRSNVRCQDEKYIFSIGKMPN